jgi:hypothetical protein
MTSKHYRVFVYILILALNFRIKEKKNLHLKRLVTENVFIVYGITIGKFGINRGSNKSILKSSNTVNIQEKKM